jgi:hypothetical protein
MPERCIYVCGVDTEEVTDSLAAFVLNGHTFYARWHADEWTLDEVVVAASGAWAFATREDCLAAWPSWRPDLSEPPIPADYDTVRGWLAGLRFAVPAEDLLNVWNFAGDVARGVRLAWHDRGHVPDQVFDKLTVASVTWIAGRENYAPRWSARELAAARRVGAQAVGLLRRALAHSQ